MATWRLLTMVSQRLFKRVQSQKHSAEHPSIWLLRWWHRLDTTLLWIGGLLEYWFMRCWSEWLHSTIERGSFYSWKFASHVLSSLTRTNTRSIIVMNLLTSLSNCSTKTRTLDLVQFKTSRRSWIIHSSPASTRRLCLIRKWSLHSMWPPSSTVKALIRRASTRRAQPRICRRQFYLLRSLTIWGGKQQSLTILTLRQLIYPSQVVLNPSQRSEIGRLTLETAAGSSIGEMRNYLHDSQSVYIYHFIKILKV